MFVEDMVLEFFLKIVVVMCMEVEFKVGISVCGGLVFKCVV